MRVLHVIPSLSPSQGGPSFALPVLERQLAALGIDVETATTDDDGRRRHVEKPLGTPLAENDVCRWYFPKQTEFYKLSLPFRRWLKREICRFDVVHIHALFSYTSVIAARISRKCRIPYIVRPLGVLNNYGMTHRRRRLKSLSFRCIERSILEDAAAVHFTSSQEKVEAECLGIRMRSAVIPLGIEAPETGSPDEFLDHHPALRSKHRILFLSRLDPKKNVESLLCAFVQVRKKLLDVALIICGDGDPDYVGELKNLAASLGISEDVTWTGRVEGAFKASAFAAAEIFVLASFSENFGIVALEAMAAGVPTIVSRGVALADEIETAGAGACTEPTPEAVAEAILRLVNNPSMLDAARVAGRQLVAENYSAAVMAARLKSLYESVVAPPARGSPERASGMGHLIPVLLANKPENSGNVSAFSGCGGYGKFD